MNIAYCKCIQECLYISDENLWAIIFSDFDHCYVRQPREKCEMNAENWYQYDYGAS